MLIDEIESGVLAPEAPELFGKRILVTGIRSDLGLEIARSLASARTRLVLHGDGGSRSEAKIKDAGEGALALRVLSHPIVSHDHILRLAREAVQVFGGIDAVINLVHVGEPPALGDEAIERYVNDLLALPCLVSRVVANRMRAMLGQGTILNIIAEDRHASPRARTVAQVARSALAGLTRSDAQEWAAQGIRVNAIAPAAIRSTRDSWLSSAPDVATLAMHLASERGADLSGLVFEAYFG